MPTVVDALLAELIEEYGEPENEADALAFARVAYGAGWTEGHHARTGANEVGEERSQ